MTALSALIFDVDGTLAETEEVHRQAFNAAFAEAGMDWNWDQALYGELLKVTGGKERILHHAARIGVSRIDAPALHARKTVFYNQQVRDRVIALRPGVEALIRGARTAGLRLAIATTTSRANIESLLAATLGEESLGWFDALCCGEDVARKKPDPEVYVLALKILGLPADACLAFEDTANGLKAATGAGLRTLITPSLYSAGENFGGAEIIIRDLADLGRNPAAGALERGLAALAGRV